MEPVLENALRKKASQQSDIFIGMMREWLTMWRDDFLQMSSERAPPPEREAAIRVIVEGQIGCLTRTTPEALAGLFAKHQVLVRARVAMSLFGDLKNEEL